MMGVLRNINAECEVLLSDVVPLDDGMVFVGVEVEDVGVVVSVTGCVGVHACCNHKSTCLSVEYGFGNNMGDGT